MHKVDLTIRSRPSPVIEQESLADAKVSAQQQWYMKAPSEQINDIRFPIDS